MPKQAGSGSTSRARQDSSLEALPFGQLFLSYRNERKLSQTAIAQAINRSTSFVSLLETGQRRPSRELIDALADALGLEPDGEERSRLVRSAGYEPQELSTVVARIIDIISEQMPISESHRFAAQADLAGVVHGWLDYFKLQKQFEQGHFNDVVVQCAGLLQRTHYSPTLLTSVRMLLAETMVQQGELSSAESIAADVTASVENAQIAPQWAPTLGAEARALQGLILVHNGKYPIGKRLLEQAGAINQQLLTSGRIPDDVGYLRLGENFKRLAQVAMLQGETGNGFTFCLTAEAFLLRASPSAERERLLLRNAEQKAWAYSKMGDFQRAIELRLRTRELLEQAHDHYGVIRNLLYTGDDYLTQVKSVVKRALGEAFPHASPPSDVIRRKKVIRKALITSEARVWLGNAELSYNAALASLESEGQRNLLGRCLSNLGTVLRYRAIRDDDMQVADLAQSHLGQALTLEQGIGQRRRLPGINEALAEIAIDRGNLVNARFYYRKGIQELDSFLVDSNDDAAVAQKTRMLAALDAIEEQMHKQETVEPEQALDWVEPNESWQSLCKRLLTLTQRYVVSTQAVTEPTARSNRTDVWVAILQQFEAEPGGRMLLQNGLSDSLTVKLRAGLSPTVASKHEARHQLFSLAIQRAHEPHERSWDLCCRPHVERGLQFPDTAELVRQQVCNAYDFMHMYERGYQLDSCLDEIPLGFAVKGSHILIEVSPEVASLFLKSEDVLPNPGTQLCYEFQNEAFARDLTALFQEFVTASHRIIEQAASRESTQEWLKRLLAPLTAAPGLTGGGHYNFWSRTAR